MIFRRQYKIDDKFVAIKYYMCDGDNKIYVVLSKNEAFAKHMHGKYSYETPATINMYLHKLKIEKDFYETGNELGLRDLLRLNVIINDFIKSLGIIFGL